MYTLSKVPRTRKRDDRIYFHVCSDGKPLEYNIDVDRYGKIHYLGIQSSDKFLHHKLTDIQKNINTDDIPMIRKQYKGIGVTCDFYDKLDDNILRLRSSDDHICLVRDKVCDRDMIIVQERICCYSPCVTMTVTPICYHNDDILVLDYVQTESVTIVPTSVIDFVKKEILKEDPLSNIVIEI